MAFDEARGVTVLFGGSAGGNQTWEWNGQLWDLRTIGGPAARVDSALVYDSVRNVCVLFGGRAGGYQADTWEWDGETWTQRPVAGPGPRAGHAMAFDARRARTVLFGGETGTPTFTFELSDTWEWNGVSWTQANPVHQPGAVSFASLAFDPRLGVSVLHGGYHSSGKPGNSPQTLAWDGVDWRYVSASSGPGAWARGAMAFVGTANAVVLYAGYASSNWMTTDTWVLGQSWVNLAAPVTPGPRHYHALAYDSLRGRLVQFGGRVPPALPFLSSGETWEWEGPLSPAVFDPLTPRNLALHAGSAGSLHAAAGAAEPAEYRWQKDGQPLVNGGHVSGADSRHLRFSPAGLADVGVYRLAVTNSCGSVLSAPITVDVICEADCDHNFMLTVADFSCFQTRFVQGSPLADCDRSGSLTVADFGCFQTLFVVGCP